MMHEHWLRLSADPMTQRLGWALLHFIWQGAAVAALLAIMLWMLRSAAARYVAGCGAMFMMAACPVLTFIVLMPAASVISSPNEMRSGVEDMNNPPPIGNEVAIVGIPSRSAAPRETDVASTSMKPDPEQVMPWLVAAWSIGVIVMSIRLAGGWWRVTALRRHGRLLGDPIAMRAASIARRMSARVCLLVESTMLTSPAVVGWLRPVILLPTSALTGLSAAQLDAMLAHELAHVHRHDYLVNLIQSAIEVVLFYHPAVWWVSRRVRIERENACDDLAAEVCGDRIVYVEALAAMETLRQGATLGMTPALALAAAGSGDASLLSRVHRLLGVPTPRSRGMRRFGLLPGVVSTLAIALIVTKTTTAADPKPQAESSASTTAPATTQLVVSKPGDKLYYVGGDVVAPGAYTLSGQEITMLQALIAARLDTDASTERHVLLRRRLDDKAVELYAADIQDLINDPKRDRALQGGDQLIVRPGPVSLRKFVRVVVVPDGYTFEGVPMTPEGIAAKLAELPDHAHTALELAYGSEEITLKQWTQAQSWATATISQSGLNHLTIIGLQKPGSKGSPPTIDNSAAVKSLPAEGDAEKRIRKAVDERTEGTVSAIRQRKDPAARETALNETLKNIRGGSTEDKVLALKVIAQVSDVPFDRDAIRQAVLEALKDSEPTVRAAALVSMETVRPGMEAWPQIAALAEDVDPSVRASVPRALVVTAKGRPPEAFDAIIEKLLVDESVMVRQSTVRSLWGVNVSPKAEKILIEMSRDGGGTSGLPYDALYYALSTRDLVSLPVAERLIEILPDPDPNRSGRASWGMSHHTVSKEAAGAVRAAFIRTLDETLQPYIRSNCLYGLGALGGADAVKKLRGIAADETESAEFRELAKDALQRAENQ